MGADMSDEPSCPCGCGMTRDEAIRSLMNAPLTYGEADALLSEMYPGEPPMPLRGEASTKGRTRLR